MSEMPLTRRKNLLACCMLVKTNLLLLSESLPARHNYELIMAFIRVNKLNMYDNPVKSYMPLNGETCVTFE